ncbi:hypothetical protein GCM10023238_30520 [Streptomyces heliomycini]
MRSSEWADGSPYFSRTSAEGDFEYTNLAVRGTLLDQIVAGPAAAEGGRGAPPPPPPPPGGGGGALALGPRLVSFCAGGNDITPPGQRSAEVAERYRAGDRPPLTAVAGTVCW